MKSSLFVLSKNNYNNKKKIHFKYFVDGLKRLKKYTNIFLRFMSDISASRSQIDFTLSDCVLNKYRYFTILGFTVDGSVCPILVYLPYTYTYSKYNGRGHYMCVCMYFLLLFFILISRVLESAARNSSKRPTVYIILQYTVMFVCAFNKHILYIYV